MSSIEIQQKNYSVWLNTFEPSKQDIFENYLDWIIQEQSDNDVSDVFILASTGKLIVKKCSSAHAEVVVEWASDNVAKDSVNELMPFLNCGKLKHVDYTFNTTVLRVFYVSVGERPVIVGFINSQSCYMGKFDLFTKYHVERILEYPLPPPPTSKLLVILYFYAPTQYPYTPRDKTPINLGDAMFFAFDAERNEKNNIGNCMGADIAHWIRTGGDHPKVIYISHESIVTPFNEITTILFTNHSSEWISFLKKHFFCSRIEFDTINDPTCPEETQQELKTLGGTHPVLTSMGQNPKLTLQLTFRGD